jgi:hypothetical protein
MCIVTIPYLNRINHLFQNGRALLKCHIFIPPTTSSNTPDMVFLTIFMQIFACLYAKMISPYTESAWKLFQRLLSQSGNDFPFD